MTQQLETQAIQTAVNRGDMYEEQSAKTIRKYTLAILWKKCKEEILI